MDKVDERSKESRSVYSQWIAAHPSPQQGRAGGEAELLTNGADLDHVSLTYADDP